VKIIPLGGRTARASPATARTSDPAEIYEGLNVVENWQGANSFNVYGCAGEFASNLCEDAEVAMPSLHLPHLCVCAPLTVSRYWRATAR